MTTTQWYAVRYRPPVNRNRMTCIVEGSGTREFVIETLLRRHGFEVFLPTRKVWRQKSRYVKEKHLVSYPLLVGWVFVGWPVDQYRFHDLFRVNLVHDVVAVDGVPFQIPQNIMDDLFRRWGGPKTQAPERERFMRTHHEFTIGDAARVVEGPFEDQIIKVVDLRGAKAKILLRIMGGEQIIEIDARNLEVA